MGRGPEQGQQSPSPAQYSAVLRALEQAPANSRAAPRSSQHTLLPHCNLQAKHTSKQLLNSFFLKAFWAKTPDPSSQGHLQPHKLHHTHTPPVSQAPHNQTPLTCDSGGESLREPHAACPSHSLPRSMKASTALDPHPVPAAQLLPPTELLLPRVPGVPARHLPGSSEQTGSACCCHAEGRAVQEVAE